MKIHELISVRQLYLMMFIAMSIIVLGNLWNLILTYSILRLPQKISSIAGIFFSLLWVYLFWMFYSTTSANKSEIKPDKEILNVLKNIDKEVKNGQKKQESLDTTEDSPRTD